MVDTLDRAKKTILVQAYSFTSDRIAKAIVEAHKRGVVVKVILDKGQKSEQYSSADFLVHAGIAVKIDSSHKIAHSKIIIVDGDTVITGSFNFSKAAETENSENLLVIKDDALAEQYAKNWFHHNGHSEAYAGR